MIPEHEEKIFVDKIEFENLQKEYPAAKEDIKKEVEKACEYWNKNLDKWGEEPIKNHWINKIKRSITLINMDAPEEKDEIPQLLKKPDLLEIINKEFNKRIIGEEETRKAIFICACGVFVKNLNAVFNILVNGESSVGKSWVTRNVLSILPENIFGKDTYRTRISSKALTYWHNSKVEPDWTWDGKVLYLEDVGNDILNSDVFKVMTSEGSTATIVGRYKGKNIELPSTFDIEIEGKPIMFITTATGTPFEEIKNRFFLIDLDESENQTDKIMEMQTKWAIKGEIDKYDEGIKQALSYLKRVEVILPLWAEQIRKFIPRKDVLRWRREFPRLLEIIKCSAALHQYQREKVGDMVIANEQDYEIAKQVMGKISASSGVEGLTHREKIAFEIIKQFYKENEKGCTKAEIYAYKPLYSDRGWEKILDRLANKGLLSVKLEINPDTNRKASNFYPIDLENLELPSFKILTEQKEQKESEIVYKRITSRRYTLYDSISSSCSVSSVSSVSVMILKGGKLVKLDLEEGKEYSKEDFGDNAEQVIKILLDEGKVKIHERYK